MGSEPSSISICRVATPATEGESSSADRLNNQLRLVDRPALSGDYVMQVTFLRFKSCLIVRGEADGIFNSAGKCFGTDCLLILL